MKNKIHIENINTEQVQSIFPRVFKFENLIECSSLPEIKFASINYNNNTKSFSVSFILNDLNNRVNVYLMINNKIYDMFYQIFNGEFIFNKVYANDGDLISIFYVSHYLKKSRSIEIIIKR